MEVFHGNDSFFLSSKDHLFKYFGLESHLGLDLAAIDPHFRKRLSRSWWESGTTIPDSISAPRASASATASTSLWADAKEPTAHPPIMGGGGGSIVHDGRV
jgi:hypothetical protein